MRTDIEADIFDDLIDDLLSGRLSQRPDKILRRKTTGEEPVKEPHISLHHSTTGQG